MVLCKKRVFSQNQLLIYCFLGGWYLVIINFWRSLYWIISSKKFKLSNPDKISFLTQNCPTIKSLKQEILKITAEAIKLSQEQAALQETFWYQAKLAFVNNIPQIAVTIAVGVGVFWFRSWWASTLISVDESPASISSVRRINSDLSSHIQYSQTLEKRQDALSINQVVLENNQKKNSGRNFESD